MHVQKGCPHFSRPLLHTATFLLPYRKNNQGVVRNGGLPPRCPTFPFCVILCKGAQTISVPGICGIAAHNKIQISMGCQGCGVQCWGPWWPWSLAWMVWSNFAAAPKAETFLWLPAWTERWPQQVSEVRVGSFTQRTGICSSINGKH